ncbi:hypothetical protein Tco_0332849 [Tanacetum coccineum]
MTKSPEDAEVYLDATKIHGEVVSTEDANETNYLRSLPSAGSQIDEYDLEEMDLKWQGILLGECRIREIQDKGGGRGMEFGENQGMGAEQNGKKEDSKSIGDQLMEKVVRLDNIIHTEPSELVSEPVVNESNIECQPKVWSDAPIIEEYESDSEDEYVSIPTKEQETPSFANQQVKTPRETVKNQYTHSQKPKVDKKELGYGFTVRACFVCGSLNHLIRDCDFHEKRMARKAELNNGWNKKSSQREKRPIWNNVQRVNKQNQFVPSAVLTRTGKIPVNTARTSGTKNISTARQSFNRQAVLTSTAMKVNTVKPIVNRVRPANVFHKTHSPTFKAFQTQRQQYLAQNSSKNKSNF